MQGSRQNVSGNVKLPSCEKPLSFALHAEDEMDFVNGKRASLSNPFFLFSSFPLGTDNNTYFVIQQEMTCNEWATKSPQIQSPCFLKSFQTLFT